MICLTDFSLTEVNGLNLSNFNWLQRRDTYQKRISEFTKCLSGNKSTARKRNKHRTKKNFTIDSTMMIVNEQRLAWSKDKKLKQLQSIRKI